MYSDEDINSAIAAGAISAEAANALRTHVANLHHMPRGDEENFRLINSFNDIFVAIGVVIMLVAMGAIGMQIGKVIAPVTPLDWATATEAQFAAYGKAKGWQNGMQMTFAGLLIAPVAWGLAEFFTRRRRMALPSILLLLAFVGAVFAALMGLVMAVTHNGGSERLDAILASGAALAAAGAAWLHWRRFHGTG